MFRTPSTSVQTIIRSGKTHRKRFVADELVWLTGALRFRRGSQRLVLEVGRLVEVVGASGSIKITARQGGSESKIAITIETIDNLADLLEMVLRVTRNKNLAEASDSDVFRALAMLSVKKPGDVRSDALKLLAKAIGMQEQKDAAISVWLYDGERLAKGNLRKAIVDLMQPISKLFLLLCEAISK